MFLNGRENIYPTNAIGFLAKYIPFTLDCRDISIKNIFYKLEAEWINLKKYSNSLDIEFILENLGDNINIIFDYQVMYNKKRKNKLYDNIYHFDNCEEGHSLTFKIYEYKNELKIYIYYSKNNPKQVIDSIIDNFINFFNDFLG